MKIPDPNTTPTGAAQPSGVDSAKRAESIRIGSGGSRAGGANASGGADEVRLSGLGGKLSELAEDGQVSPDKAARMGEVEKLIERGQYEIPARELASRIIDDAIVG